MLNSGWETGSCRQPPEASGNIYSAYKIKPKCLCKMGPQRLEHALLYVCSLMKPIRFSTHKQGWDLALGEQDVVFQTLRNEKQVLGACIFPVMSYKADALSSAILRSVLSFPNKGCSLTCAGNEHEINYPRVTFCKNTAPDAKCREFITKHREPRSSRQICQECFRSMQNSDTGDMKSATPAYLGEAEDSPGRAFGVCCSSLSPACDLKAVLLSSRLPGSFSLGARGTGGSPGLGELGVRRAGGEEAAPQNREVAAVEVKSVLL